MDYPGPVCFCSNCFKPIAFYKGAFIKSSHSFCLTYTYNTNFNHSPGNQDAEGKTIGNKISRIDFRYFGSFIIDWRQRNRSTGDNIVLGDFLVILSSIAYTFYFILVKPLMDRHAPIVVVRWVFTFGFFFTLPLCFREFTEIQWQAFTPKHWFLLFMIVIPGTSLAYIFNVYGIKVLSASTAGAYIYSQPIFAVIIAMLFLHQKLTLVIVIAGILIFSGVFLSNRKPRIILLE